MKISGKTSLQSLLHHQRMKEERVHVTSQCDYIHDYPESHLAMDISILIRLRIY